MESDILTLSQNGQTVISHTLIKIIRNNDLNYPHKLIK